MMMSPSSMSAARSLTVSPAYAAGTITHAARGLSSLLTNSSSVVAPVAPSDSSCFTDSSLRSKATQSCPSRMRRRTRLAPIRPRPTIPNCMARRYRRRMDLGTVLSVWAHPDDETYLGGGLMSEAVRRGNRVVCVTATRGELGSPDEERWPSGAPLAEVRTKELMEALAELGVAEHIWLDYPAGGCIDVDAAEAVDRLRTIIADVGPDTVLTFGPDGITGHDDHI